MPDTGEAFLAEERRAVTYENETEITVFDGRLEPRRSRAPRQPGAVAARERHLAVQRDVRRLLEVLYFPELWYESSRPIAYGVLLITVAWSHR